MIKLKGKTYLLLADNHTGSDKVLKENKKKLLYFLSSIYKDELDGVILLGDNKDNTFNNKLDNYSLAFLCSMSNIFKEKYWVSGNHDDYKTTRKYYKGFGFKCFKKKFKFKLGKLKFSALHGDIYDKNIKRKSFFHKISIWFDNLYYRIRGKSIEKDVSQSKICDIIYHKILDRSDMIKKMYADNKRFDYILHGHDHIQAQEVKVKGNKIIKRFGIGDTVEHFNYGIIDIDDELIVRLYNE